MNTITCPHCGKPVEISEALRHQFEVEFGDQHKLDLEKAKKEGESAASQKVKDEYEVRLKEIAQKEEEDKVRRDKLMQDLLKANQEKEALKRKDEERELEMQKLLIAEREKIQIDTEKRVTEKTELEKQELRKQLDDTKKLLEDAQRKANQKSQQLQGEVLELEIEQMLRAAFPQDEIIPVGKGVSGADICQIVKSPRGFPCGKILWELKRTQSWSDKWIPKLKEDMRMEKAELAVIISIDLPEDAKDGIGHREGIVIAGHLFILPVATMLRKNLLDVGYEKAKSVNKGEKAEVIFSYITSTEFQQQIVNIVDAYREMHDQIIRERTAFEKIWKQREAQAQRVLTSTANIFGTLQGTAGASMQTIKGLDVMELESGDL